jgi:CBS domain-containing protein
MLPAMPSHKPGGGALQRIRVSDCMHAGIVGCALEASVGEVAEIMARHRVHAVVVGSEKDRGARVVSDYDVVVAVAGGEALTAAQAASNEPLWVSGNDSLQHAAQLMAEHRVSHLVVHDGTGGYPVGVLSALDIASAYAGLTVERPSR